MMNSGSPANLKGSRQFFWHHRDRQEQTFGSPVHRGTMEGFNGYARPLDTLVRARDYRLFNINDLKLARFEEIFPGANRRPMQSTQGRGWSFSSFEWLFRIAEDVSCRRYAQRRQENDILKRLSRRRRRLVDERVRVVNNLQADLHAICPGLLEITGEADNMWFLRFLTSTDDLRKLARMREATIRKIPGIGKKYASVIVEWQKMAQFNYDVEWVGEMIQEDAVRVLELHDKIQSLEAKMEGVACGSDIAKTLATIPGFGSICTAELAGEIGTVERFGSEANLALYIGMANLDNSSGKQKGSKAPTQVKSGQSRNDDCCRSSPKTSSAVPKIL